MALQLFRRASAFLVQRLDCFLRKCTFPDKPLLSPASSCSAKAQQTRGPCPSTICCASSRESGSRAGPLANPRILRSTSAPVRPPSCRAASKHKKPHHFQAGRPPRNPLCLLPPPLARRLSDSGGQ